MPKARRSAPHAGTAKPTTNAGKQLGIQSVEVAGEVLRALCRTNGTAKLIDLARATGMPSAKVHRYLVSLIRIGLVAQDSETSRYDLGPFAIQLGLESYDRIDFIRKAGQTLEALGASAGETAALALWSRSGPTIVRIAETRREIGSHVHLGHICPMTFSATGLVYCAFAPPEQTQHLIENEIRQNRLTGRPLAPKTLDELRVRTEETRHTGIAHIDNPAEGLFSALSVPVFDYQGTLLMALTLYAPKGSIDTNIDGALARLLIDAGTHLSRSLGYRSVSVA